MVRIAHFSDLHYGPKNLIEADRCFGTSVDMAMAAGVQAAVLSGDSTDHALDLHSPAAERLVAQVRRLADHCPVLMLQGTFSHEPPGTLSIFKSLGGRYPVHVADQIGQAALMPNGCWQVSASWRFDVLPDGLMALFSCVPTVNKAAVAPRWGLGLLPGSGRAPGLPAGRVCREPPTSSGLGRAVHRRVAWHCLWLHERARRAHGRIRPRVHHGRIVLC